MFDIKKKKKLKIPKKSTHEETSWKGSPAPTPPGAKSRRDVYEDDVPSIEHLRRHAAAPPSLRFRS